MRHMLFLSAIQRTHAMALLFLVLILFSLSAQARPAPESFADIIDKLTPAVVNIATTQTVSPKEMVSPFGNLPPGHPFEGFDEFFEQFMENQPGMDQKLNSLGSGFIIDPAGYIVTNYHVIDKAEEITVQLNDNSRHEAKVIGSDKKSDIAILKIEAGKELPAVTFGDSSKSRVGDWVLAIGNPFGLGGTVTAGIISATSRDINSGPFDDYIQTDAAINRGNSGGPMFNLEGEVIGINTAIFSPMGVGNIGIGFAVPSNMALPVIEQLKQGKKVQRGWLGVKIQTITDDLAEGLGMKETKGALVVEVMPDSPAAKAGIKSGDVILSFDGKGISEMRRLPRIVAETAIGKTVDVKVLRSGDEKALQVKVAELQDEEDADETKPEEETGEGKDALLGMSLKALTPELREQFNIPDDVEGLLIAGVSRKSEAAEKGIQRGDIVLELNQKKVAALAQAKEAIEKAKKDNRASVLLLIQRGDEAMFVALPLKEGNRD